MDGKRRWARFCLAVAACGLAGSGTAAARSLPETFAEVANKIEPAVVNISTTRIIREKCPDLLTQPQNRALFDKVCPDASLHYTQRSLGSGVIIDRRGYIVTNGHVVFNASEIMVKMNDSREYQASLVGLDSITDLAVIKIEGSRTWPVAEIGDSDRLQVGDWVISAGSPFGFDQTITAGIISAKSRTINSGPYDDYLQTDASINPGNSGGPLVNMDGRVVGITTAIVSSSGGSIGIGFAIPINTAVRISRDIIERGTARRGWLGVVLQPMTQQLAYDFGLNRIEGVLVSDLAHNGPAARAGLQRGDVILQFNGVALTRKVKLSRLLEQSTVGAAVPIVVARNGREIKFTVVIEQQAGSKLEGKAPLTLQPKFENRKPKLGLVTADFDAESIRRLGVWDRNGAVVAMVVPGSLAEKAGFVSGDIIRELNRRKISNRKAYLNLLKNTPKDKDLLFLVERDGYTVYIPVPLEKWKIKNG